MAADDLERVPLNVPLFAGQNSSADPRIVEPGALLQVDNGRFVVNGQLQKRFGVTSLSNLDTDGHTITRGRQIFAAGNALFLHDGDNLYVYNLANDVWLKKGAMSEAVVQNTVMAQSQNDVQEVASAATANAVAICWREGTALYLSVYSPLDGVFLQSATQLTPNGQTPQVLACSNGNFMVGYVDNTVVDLKLALIASNGLSTIANTVTVTNALSISRRFDACSVTLNSGAAGTAVVARVTAGTPRVKLFLYDSNLSLQSTTNFDTASWAGDSTMWVFTLDDRAAAGVPVIVFGNQSYYFVTGNTSTVYSGAVPANTRRIYGVGQLSLAYPPGNYCFLERTVTVGGNTQIFVQSYEITNNVFFPYNSLNVPSDTVAAFFTNQNCRLASRPFIIPGTYAGRTNAAFCWVLCDFALQTQLVLIDQEGRPIGRALTNGNAANGADTNLALPAVSRLGDSNGMQNVYFATRRRAQLKFDVNGNVSTTVGVTLLNLRYTGAVTPASNVGGSTYIAGAAPKLFDGRTLTELGFWFYCDTPVLTENVNTGFLSAGTYNYALCYAWYDNNGKLWRSPVILVPSGNTSQPTGASGATITVAQGSSVTLSNITFLQGTAKQNVFIEVYRTKVNLSQYYKITQIPNVNAQGSLSTSYTDGLADSSLVGEILYTDGSTPSYISPPGFAYICATPTRLYGLVSESNEIWASTLTSRTQPAQFLLGQSFGLPTLQSPPNCCEILDGQLYVFSPDTILTTNADGTYLSATGTLQFVPPRALPVDTGCRTPASLLRTEEGLWYQSNKGLTVLARNQQTAFVGEPVKDMNDLDVLSAVLLSDQQQVRFTTSGAAIVYDYVFKRWSTNSYNYNPAAACKWRGNYVDVSTGGRAHQEQQGTFADDGSFYTRTVVTPWIKPGGINGYARCWRFVILGEGRDQHTLQVRIAYQYDETWVDTLTINSQAANPSVYGVGLGTYGLTSAGIYGQIPAANVYQFEAVMPRQKATAFKFEITDINNSGTGEACVLTMLTLLCGVYSGLARMPAAKGFG